jgi:hypothetical protein
VKYNPNDGGGMKRRVEKRKHIRYDAKKGIIAKVDHYKVGPITDISLAGVCFRYIDLGFEHSRCSEDIMRISIAYGDTFRLDNLPCKVVKAKCALPKYNLSSGKMFKCRIKFGELTSAQESLLEFFIEHYTADSFLQSRFDGLAESVVRF